MQIDGEAEVLSFDLAYRMVPRRVSGAFTLDVDLVYLHGGDMPHQEISGAVVDIDVNNVGGQGGLDPFIENSRQELKSLVRTMGTNS